MDLAERTYPPDETERALPDFASARDFLEQHDPAVLEYLAERRQRFQSSFDPAPMRLLEATYRAVVIALARFARRHGSASDDLHAYHNENHALELLGDRLEYLCEQGGPNTLPPEDWLLLALFAATHDLRQRETPDPDLAVGANERASIAEAHRIMAQAGFDPKADLEAYQAIEMMIAGSTFRVGAAAGAINPSAAAGTVGALAPELVEEFCQAHPDWRSDPAMKRRVRLTLIASDLDTANVSEPFLRLAASAVKLCCEIEYRCGRALHDEESAGPVYAFLTDAQENYFFGLHQFDSRIGAQVLKDLKAANAPKLRALVDHMRKTFVSLEGVSGQQVIDEFVAQARRLETAS